MSAVAIGASRRWLVPEVVQTSPMDCGPASLKALLEGFRVPVSYGRLREACQTDVDGTSIDTLELLANQLGVQAEQVMLPLDHLFLVSSKALPALVVVQHSDGATHFLVVWRRVGQWVQVMDPAVGRRWLRLERFTETLFRHETDVDAQDWRAWAALPDFLEPLRERLARVGVSTAGANELIEEALADEGWFGLGALDAAVRFATAIVDAGGVRVGPEAHQVLCSVFRDTHRGPEDIFQVLPPRYWSAHALRLGSAGRLRLTLQGAVLVRFAGRNGSAAVQGPDAVRSPELKAALVQAPAHPLAMVAKVLRDEGRLALLALGGAMGLSVGAVLIEALLFRGLFDIAIALALPSQRLLALVAVIAFGALLLVVEIGIASEVMRLGRSLETRLRLSLLERLPQLDDRYFHSRPVSDMAERSHSLQGLRLLPGWALHILQAVCGLAFTLAGVVLLDHASMGPAVLLAVAAVGMPLLVQPLLNERDLRVRNHAVALHASYFDALMGLVPIRSHGAETAVRRRHEGLLVEWVRACRAQFRLSLAAAGLQSLVCVSLAIWLVIAHFGRGAAVSGADLLLVYWIVKLPALGQTLAALAQQYPAQRNVLLRLLEPMSAPVAAGVREEAEEQAPAQTPAGPVGLQVEVGEVVLAGRLVLRDLQMSIRPGEHVAVVGASGAGKSTILGLLLGWHALAQGTLRVDGEPADSTGLARLRAATAWVDPAIQLWNRPLLENLLYASDYAEGAGIGPVLDMARLGAVLEKLPQGLQTWLGEGGALLAGGEGQRVRLARALLQTGVRLALLDEPFRGLDRGQRHELLAAARTHWKAATLFCVTHDVSETLAFDRVLVVEDGRIVEDASPLQLVGTDSRYSAMLRADQAVDEQLWQGSRWRRVQVVDGTLHGGGRPA